MSYRYREIVFPEAEHFLHRPSAAQLEAVLECLAANGWCRRTTDDDLYVSLPDAKRAATTAPAGVVHAYLQGVWEGTPDDWPMDEPLFEPNLIEDVTLLSSPVLLLLPGDMNGSSLFCPSCNEDIVRALQYQRDRAYEPDVGPEYEMVRHGFLLVPARCPKCEGQLDHKSMVLELETLEDEAPFCHFAIVLQALRRPSVELVYLDPEVLSQLSNACGVPLRSTGRLQ